MKCFGVDMYRSRRPSRLCRHDGHLSPAAPWGLRCVLLTILGLMLLARMNVQQLDGGDRLHVSSDQTLDRVMYAIEQRDVSSLQRLLRTPGMRLNGIDRQQL